MKFIEVENPKVGSVMTSLFNSEISHIEKCINNDIFHLIDSHIYKLKNRNIAFIKNQDDYYYVLYNLRYNYGSGTLKTLMKTFLNVNSNHTIPRHIIKFYECDQIDGLIKCIKKLTS